jgi:hypothetical protein
VPPACEHKAACLVRLSGLPRQDAARRPGLYCHDRPVHRLRDAAGTVKEVRQDAGPERRLGGLEARHSDEIVAVRRLAACLAVRRDGLAREGPKGTPDVQDIVGQVLGRRSVVAHRALLPPDEHPPERRVPRLALQVVAVLLV